MTKLPYRTAIELSNELGLPLAWVKAQAKEGRLPCLRIGRQLRFDVPAVCEALERRDARPQADPKGGAR